MLMETAALPGAAGPPAPPFPQWDVRPSGVEASWLCAECAPSNPAAAWAGPAGKAQRSLPHVSLDAEWLAPAARALYAYRRILFLLLLLHSLPGAWPRGRGKGQLPCPPPHPHLRYCGEKKTWRWKVGMATGLSRKLGIMGQIPGQAQWRTSWAPVSVSLWAQCSSCTLILLSLFYYQVYFHGHAGANL